MILTDTLCRLTLCRVKAKVYTSFSQPDHLNKMQICTRTKRETIWPEHILALVLRLGDNAYLERLDLSFNCLASRAKSTSRRARTSRTKPSLKTTKSTAREGDVFELARVSQSCAASYTGNTQTFLASPWQTALTPPPVPGSPGAQHRPRSTRHQIQRPLG